MLCRNLLTGENTEGFRGFISAFPPPGARVKKPLQPAEKRGAAASLLSSVFVGAARVPHMFASSFLCRSVSPCDRMQGCALSMVRTHVDPECASVSMRKGMKSMPAVL